MEVSDFHFKKNISEKWKKSSMTVKTYFENNHTILLERVHKLQCKLTQTHCLI
jgi:hypothetical protein